MVAVGKSDQEIREFYVKQYGQQVLAEPPGTQRVILYAIPVTITAVGVLVVVLYLRRALQTRSELDRTGTRVIANAAALDRVRADIGDF